MSQFESFFSKVTFFQKGPFLEVIDFEVTIPNNLFRRDCDLQDMFLSLRRIFFYKEENYWNSRE